MDTLQLSAQQVTVSREQVYSCHLQPCFGVGIGRAQYRRWASMVLCNDYYKLIGISLHHRTIYVMIWRETIVYPQHYHAAFQKQDNQAAQHQESSCPSRWCRGQRCNSAQVPAHVHRFLMRVCSEVWWVHLSVCEPIPRLWGSICVCLCGRYRSIHVLLCIQVVDGYLVRSKQRFYLFPSVKYMYF